MGLTRELPAKDEGATVRHDTSLPYVRDAWYVAAWSRDLGAQRPFAISILETAE